MEVILKSSIKVLFWVATILILNSSAIAQITIADSSRNFLLNIHGQLMDSAAVTNFGKVPGRSNVPTHYDNSASVRFSIDGKFTDSFLFDARVKVSTDHTNRDIVDHFYNPDEGIPYNKQSENKRTWDLFAAKASYQLEPVLLMAGFDYLEWGPARRNHVILRGESSIYRPWEDEDSRIHDPAPTPYFGYRFEIGPVEYTQYAAKLFEKKGAGKFLHAHRLDLKLPAAINLGLSETSLYGTTTENAGTNPNADADSSGRDFEWAYVIPFIPYVFQEHLQGDRDNISMAFDLSVKTIPNWEFYAELLWDDMKSPTSMFDDSWWGNKWATTIGLARDNLHLGPAIFNWFAEYTRIEPWVYTHHKGSGYTYTSYAQSLGSDLGPNSQEVHTELGTTLGFAKVSLMAGAVARDTSFGSNLYDIHTPESRIDKKFLNHRTTLKYTELGGSFSLTPWTWFGLRAGYTRFFGDYEGYRAYGAGNIQF